MTPYSLQSVLFASALILVGLLAWLSLRLEPAPAGAGQGWSFGTRFFLVFLRMAIGWHFLVEGIDKLQSATWSGENYLRESSGPLAPVFRTIAGDRLIDKVTVGSDKAFPAELDIQWKAYQAAVERYYELNEEQAKRLEAALAQARSNVVTWLTTRPKRVEKPSPLPPRVMVPMTMPERLKEYHAAVAQAEELEAVDLPRYGPLVYDKIKLAKSKAQQWRAGFQRDAGRIEREMKRAMRTVLLAFVLETLPADAQKRIEAVRLENEKEAKKAVIPAEEWDDEEAQQEAWDNKMLEAFRSEVGRLKDAKASLSPLVAKISDHVLEKDKGRFPSEVVPGGAGRPVGQWQLIDWSDRIVKYGLIAVGVCLLVGLLTRTACVIGAGFMLLFYVSMPPLLGLPANPRAEGHYLFINKNFIEMLALLALATTRSGRWVGLDGLLQFARIRRSRAPLPPAPVPVESATGGRPGLETKPQGYREGDIVTVK